MNSAGDVEPPVAGGHDERLLRAFDRVARLGIDLEEDDAIGDRESAAVRAFAALRLDGETETEERSTATAPPFDIPADIPVDPPTHDSPRREAAPPTDGPLRPDAVLRSRRFTPRDDEYPGRDDSDTIEVEVPPPHAQTAAVDPTASSRADDPGAPAATAATGERPPTTSAPPSTTAAPAPATDPAPSFDPPDRAGDSYLLDVAALGVASGAFVWPWAWPAAVAFAVLMGTIVCSLAAHGPSRAALLRRVVRRGLRWLAPRSLIAGAVVIARTVLLAVVAPALVCAGWWIITEGLDGAFVAARIGVWAHGWRVAAAVICFLLIVGVGEARQRRIREVRRVTGRLGGTAVTVLAALVAAAAVAVVALGPRAGGSWSSADDGLGWAPARVRDNIDRVRDDLISAEVHAASGCLSDHQDLSWRATYTTGNPPGADDVVRLSADEEAPSPAQLATAVAALHNQLAPWVEGIELAVDGDTMVVLDRAALPGGRPLVDPGDLVEGASSGGGRLVEGADDFDRAVALSCSAAPIP
jgi:hypothetical protein